MDHAILLGKLKLYGADCLSLKWIRSYLSDQKQQTFIDGAQSDFCNVTRGIPQGSIEGPLLFTIYINDIPSCKLFSKPKMYADDVWGNIGKGLSDKIQKLQNRAARILTFSNYETRSSILLEELGWESLENKRLKQLAVIMYKIP